MFSEENVLSSCCDNLASKWLHQGLEKGLQHRNECFLVLHAAPASLAAAVKAAPDRPQVHLERTLWPQDCQAVSGGRWKWQAS